MAFMAQDGNFTLLVLPDENIQYPTKETGDFGTMYLWNVDLPVGDKTSIDFPDVFLMEQVWDMEQPEKTMVKAQNLEFRDIKLEKDTAYNSWKMSYYDYEEKRNITEVFDKDVQNSDIEYAITQNMWTSDLHKLASEKNLYLPVVYENGELEAKDPSDSWYAEQIGYIFAHYDEIKELFGDVTEESLDLARNLMKEEVAIHNQFNKGNVSGFRIYDELTKIAEDWGYVGEISLVQFKIEQNLSDNLKCLAKSLEYVDMKEVENFLYECEEGEMEDER